MAIKTVEIAESFLKVIERKAAMYDALEAGGVDNWDWYSESLKGFFDDEDEEDIYGDDDATID